MDLKIIEESVTNIRVQVENEDFSILDIIHLELLKDSKVVIAGVITPHPLLKQYLLKINVKKKVNPMNVLAVGCGRAVKNSEALLKEARRAFKEGGN
ncbi:MAG: RpoL/Rpb11 RNA polymerase subunit family protein [Nitrososphaerales archaeon]